MVFLWFSYGFPIKTSIFLWFSHQNLHFPMAKLTGNSAQEMVPGGANHSGSAPGRLDVSMGKAVTIFPESHGSIGA
jgi:hypothetical protein